MLPPPFLAAFDAEKIAFVPYNDIQEIFYQNDFNWNVTPSDYETKEFKLVHEKVKESVRLLGISVSNLNNASKENEKGMDVQLKFEF